MDFSQFVGRLREKLTRFSGELCHRLGKTATRFVVEAVYVKNPEFFVHLFRKRSYSDSGSARTPIPVISRTL